MKFANSVLDVITDRGWRHSVSEYCEWFKSWIDILCKVVDFKDQYQLQDYVKALFAHQEYPVTCVDFLKPYIETQVLHVCVLL